MSDLAYSILLPPGWVRIPTARAAAEFAALVQSAVDQAAPEYRPQIRAFLEGQTALALNASRDQPIVEFVIPLAPVLGVPVPATITVTAITPPASEQRSNQEILVAMAGAGDATAIEVDGLVGIRRSRPAGAASGTATPGDGLQYRNISYICHHPARNQWVTFTASILANDDPELKDQLDAVEALIDAMISTVRFERVERGVESGDGS